MRALGKRCPKIERNAVLLVLVCLFAIGNSISLASAAPEEPSTGYGLALLAAGLCLGLAGLGVGIGMGTLGAAGIASVAEKPEVFSKVILFIVFIEAIAIYALTLSFMLLMKV